MPEKTKRRVEFQVEEYNLLSRNHFNDLGYTVDEILVFTPYLIHGAGINLQNDITRVSLEMRYWRDHE